MTGVKKKPLRKCIGCGEQKEKKELIRVLRTTDGMIMIDESGRQNGRGAYVCRKKACMEKAFKSKALERSLHCRVDEQVYEELQKRIVNSDEEIS